MRRLGFSGSIRPAGLAKRTLGLITNHQPRAALRVIAEAAFILVGCVVSAIDVDAQQPEPVAAYTETIEINGQKITFEMQPIPGGRFTIGSPETEPHRNEDEGPQVELEVAPFWMSRTEVTWRLYDQFMAEYDGYLNHPQHRIPADDADAVSFPTPLYEPGHTFEKVTPPTNPP